MSNMKISVVGEYIFFSPKTLKKLESIGETSFKESFPTEEHIIRNAYDANVLITWGKITPEIIKQCPKLEVISLLATGYDEITTNKELIIQLNGNGFVFYTNFRINTDNVNSVIRKILI